MWIRYVVPEDGDDFSHPNIFRCNDNGELVLSTVKKIFPIPGEFHFRFLKKIGEYTVWMDIFDENAVIPSHQGTVFIKATRLSTYMGNNSPAPTAGSRPTPAPAPMQRADSTSKSASAAVPPVPPKPVKATPKPVEEKLLNFHDEPTPVAPAATIPTPTAAPTPSTVAPQTQSSPFFDEDLLGFNSVPSSAQSSSSTSQPAFADDPFGSTPLLPTQASTSPPPRTGGNPMHAGFGTSSSSSSTMNAFQGMSAPPVNVMGSGYGRGGNGGMNSMNAGMGGGMAGGMGGGGGMNPMARGSNAFDPFSTLNVNNNNNNNSTKSNTSQRKW